MNWIAGVLGGIVAYRLWTRRRKPAPAPVAAPPAAGDGRPRRGASREARRVARERRAFSASEPAEPAEAEESLEERRSRVHEEGRAAIDRMNDT